MEEQVPSFFTASLQSHLELRYKTNMSHNVRTVGLQLKIVPMKIAQKGFPTLGLWCWEDVDESVKLASTILKVHSPPLYREKAEVSLAGISKSHQTKLKLSACML